MAKFISLLLCSIPMTVYATPSYNDAMSDSYGGYSPSFAIAFISLVYYLNTKKALPVIAGWVVYYCTRSTMFYRGSDWILALLCSAGAFYYFHKKNN